METHTELWPGFSTVSLRPTDTFICIGCSNTAAKPSLLLTDALRGDSETIDLVPAPLQLHAQLGDIRPVGTVLWSLPAPIGPFALVGFCRICVVLTLDGFHESLPQTTDTAPTSTKIPLPSARIDLYTRAELIAA
jgi:hypothetical protein